MSPRAREPLPDALRAAALAGVLLVNAVGYLDAPWGPLLGVPRPEDSSAATALHWLLATFVQGKAYPLLAFLFGLGLALAWRRHRGLGEPPMAAARRRQWRLLVLGIAHGLLLYFGDILTMYALVGLLVLKHVDAPWRQLRRLLRRAVLWSIAVTLAGVLMAGMATRWPTEDVAEPARIAEVTSMAEWLALNATSYLWGQFGALLLFLPVLRLCMLAGIAAARLRWLHHPRWHGAHRHFVRRAWLPMLMLNAAYGVAMVTGNLATPLGERAWWVEAASPLAGLPLATLLLSLSVLHAARHPNGLWRRLVPLGRRTLSGYLLHSLACLLLFSGVGLGLQPGSAILVAWALALWLTLAFAATRARAPWWPERWLAR